MPLADSGTDKQLPPTASDQSTQALNSLRQESQLHARQDANSGLIGKALSGVTEFWHGSEKNGQQVNRLANDLLIEIKSGNNAAATKLAEQAQDVVQADKKSLNISAQIEQYGSGLVKSVGLFMPGKMGYVVAAGAAALDAYKPGQNSTATEKVVDVALDVTKAMGLKGAFDYSAKHNWSIASTAVGLGVASRVSDVALTRTNYLDDKGAYSAKSGLSTTFEAATNTSALASDVASFVIARGALGKLSKVSGGTVLESRMVSTVLTGGIFGASKGSVDEVLRQSKAGVFEPGQFGSHVLASATSNMIGAAIAGKLSGARLEATKAGESAASEKIETVKIANNFPGATTREYQMVGQALPVAEAMAASKQAYALTRVREVKPGGELGPEQNLLIQHNSKTNPIESKSAAALACDLIASCNPALLPGFLKAKHIFTSAQDNLWLSQTGSRLRFANTIEKLGDHVNAVALGDKSVSSILRAPDARQLLRHKDTHDLGLYAEVLKDFKIPGRKIIDGGADSVVIELSNDQILKITPNNWDPTWGRRTYTDAQGLKHRFDARIIGEPTLTDGPYGKANFYIQERVQTPVSETSMMLFAHKLDADRKYSFTDRDTSQLGYTDLGGGKKGLVVIDYDAVELSNMVMQNMRNRRS